MCKRRFTSSESDDTEELWMTEFVCTAKRHKHVQNSRRMIVNQRVLEGGGQLPPRDAPSPTQYACVSLPRKKQPRFKSFTLQSLVLLVNRKNDKVCDGVFFKP